MTATTKKKWLLAVELVLFLFALPILVVSIKAYGFRRFILIAGGLYALWRLMDAVSWRFLFARPAAGWWVGPLCRGALVFLLAVLFVLSTDPDTLFLLPRERLHIWTGIVLLYPWLSVLPQELIYRVYLFEVMRPLWGRTRAAVPVSAFLFGWVHIIYTGWFAVLLSAAGGVALAWNYARVREHKGAIWPLILEHSLYGLSMFTVGLGRYFFLPR